MEHKFTKLTPEQMLEMVGNPIKLAQILYMLANLPDIEQIIEDIGELALFEMACDVVKESEGGELNG
ncbi:hypothetical protein V7075_07815 [Neobacillus drentensis]|uniref:hypothetical protein n=1 Tax=Neobacillus drentensis TaxID=220684 RepID=UPI002FFF327E